MHIACGAGTGVGWDGWWKPVPKGREGSKWLSLGAAVPWQIPPPSTVQGNA